MDTRTLPLFEKLKSIDSRHANRRIWTTGKHSQRSIRHYDLHYISKVECSFSIYLLILSLIKTTIENIDRYEPLDTHTKASCNNVNTYILERL